MRQISLFRCSVAFSFLTAREAFQAQAFQAEELAVDGLSQLSDELEEETAFLFAARGAAFGFFAGFFFLVPFFFFFFGTGAASVRPTKEAMLASESPASPSKQLGFTRTFTHGLAISVVRFQTSVQGAPFISFHYTASLLSCFFPGGPVSSKPHAGCPASGSASP